MGGVVTRAYSREAFRGICQDEKTVEATKAADAPMIRPNGTGRDWDILVTTTDPRVIGKIDGKIKDRLFSKYGVSEKLVSVFGLGPADTLQAQAEHPLERTIVAKNSFLSDRYAAMDGRGGVSKLFRALPPCAVQVDPQTIEPWALKIEGLGEVPMVSPAAMLLNYTQRSIGGLRGKDRPKWLEALQTIRKDCPAVLGQIHYGPYAQQAELTTLIESLRPGKPQPGSAMYELGLRNKKYTTAELVHHRAFMGRGHDFATMAAVLGVARFKAVVVHAGESLPKVVDAWQSLLEHSPIVQGIIKNQ
jgi:hypothetical protein